MIKTECLSFSDSVLERQSFVVTKSVGNLGILYYTTCTEPVLKIVDAGYCLCPHLYEIFLKSLKPFNFNNSNQLMPNLLFQQSRRDN